MLTIYCKINVNQDIETTLKQDKNEGAMHAWPPWLHCSNASVVKYYGG